MSHARGRRQLGDQCELGGAALRSVVAGSMFAPSAGSMQRAALLPCCPGGRACWVGSSDTRDGAGEPRKCDPTGEGGRFLGGRARRGHAARRPDLGQIRTPVYTPSGIANVARSSTTRVSSGHPTAWWVYKHGVVG